VDHEQHQKELEKYAASSARAAKASAVAQAASAAAQAVSAAAQIKSAAAAKRTADDNARVADSTLSKHQFERDVMWLEKSDEQGKYEFFVLHVSAQVISSRTDELIGPVLAGLNVPLQDATALASAQYELDRAQSNFDDALEKASRLTRMQQIMEYKRNNGSYRFAIRYGQSWKRKGRLFKIFFYLVSVALIWTGIALVFLIIHLLLLRTSRKIQKIDARKLAVLQFDPRIGSLKDRVNECSNQLDIKLQPYRSNLAPYYDLINEEFERQYSDEQTASAMKEAIKKAEQNYPSICRIKEYPILSGIKEDVRASVLPIAYSKLIVNAGLGKWSNLLLN
jgi:hypothetical protein